jgi:hypothetical protein
LCVTFGVGRSIFERLYMLDNRASYVPLILNIQEQHFQIHNLQE